MGFLFLQLLHHQLVTFFNIFGIKMVDICCISYATSGLQLHRWAVWGQFGAQRATRSRQHPGLLLPESSNGTGSGVSLFNPLLFCHFKRNPQMKVCASVSLPSPLVPAGKVTRKLGKRGTIHYLHPCSSTLGVRKKI